MLLAATLATLDRLGRVLPHAWLYAGARLLAPLALPLFERRRQAVRANCQRVHPEWEPADLDRAVRGVFRETAAYYVDAALLPQRTSRQVLDEQLRVDGLEILQAQVAHGKGVVLAGLHLSNPEVAFQTLPALGIDAIALVEPLKNPRAMDAIQRRRLTGGAPFVPATMGGVMQALETVRRGGVVAILSDRDLKGSGVCVPFFGRQGRFPTGAVDLALRTGAPLMAAYSVRERQGHFRVTFLPPLDLLHSDNRANDVRAGVADLIRGLEPVIAAHADQWRMFASPWKGCRDSRYEDAHGHPQRGGATADQA